MFVRYRDGSRLRITQPLDLSRAVREDSRSYRWAPPKLVRVVTRLNVAFERHAYEAARALLRRDVDPDAAPPAVERAIVRKNRPYLDAYRRLLSAAVASAVAGEIVSVRGVLVRTPVVPFDQRGEEMRPARPVLRDPEAEPALVAPDVLADVRRGSDPHVMLIFDSGWMPFVSNVDRLEVDL